MTTTEEFWQQLDNLSDVLLDSLGPKCDELGFDSGSGITSLKEAVINVKNTRDLLRDAIVKRKLIQLPITIQNQLSAQLVVVINYAISIGAGNNEVVNFVATADQLTTITWQYNLHNLSEEVVGLLEKQNQLKQLELETVDLRRQLLTALKAKKRVEELQEHAQTVDSTISQNLEKLTTKATEAGAIVKQIAEFSEKASAILATVQQTDTSLARLEASAKSREAEVTEVQKRILEFSNKIETFSTQINNTTLLAATTITTNTEKTKRLIAELEQLEEQIKAAIERATGYSLFHSFSVRQGQLNKATRRWQWILLSLVGLSVVATLLIGFTTTQFDIAFYIKLAISIPLAYSIGFCTLQYARERKLEEEYAFKSNISISLAPYKDLVEKMIDPKSAEERIKYTSFLIDAIKEVYSSPTTKIFDVGSEAVADPEEVLKRLSKTVETIIKPFEPFLNALKK